MGVAHVTRICAVWGNFGFQGGFGPPTWPITKAGKHPTAGRIRGRVPGPCNGQVGREPRRGPAQDPAAMAPQIAQRRPRVAPRPGAKAHSPWRHRPRLRTVCRQPLAPAQPAPGTTRLYLADPPSRQAGSSLRSASAIRRPSPGSRVADGALDEDGAVGVGVSAGYLVLKPIASQLYPPYLDLYKFLCPNRNISPPALKSLDHPLPPQSCIEQMPFSFCF